MPNEPGLRAKISKLSDEDLLKMVNVDFADYREEALRYAEAEMSARGLSNVNYEMGKEHALGAEDEVSPTTVEVGDEGLRRIEEHVRAVDGDYLVVPFNGKIKGGFFSSENAETVSMQLQSLINQYSRRGWEFQNIAKVDIEVAPGCLAGMFGAKTSYITFDQVIFRRPRP